MYNEGNNFKDVKKWLQKVKDISSILGTQITLTL